jgi:hypothetical protein
LLDDRSRSFIAALPESERDQLIERIRGVIDEQFPDGAMTVRYETWMWVGLKR